MNSSIFQIRNLNVNYGTETVLSVPQLDLPRGKLVFVLGNSGTGKTTFLETLALMSSHAEEASQIIYYPETTKNIGIAYSTLAADEFAKTEIRRAHFSFVFQDTLLLPEFSILHNVALARVIQEEDPKSACQKAFDKLRQLGIEDRASHAISEVSGGQRQRTAFARAVLKEGSVIFADEPTGNLGSADAIQVMQDIRRFVDESQGQKTAIVVTHNIQLALAFGDLIVVIQHNHTIVPEHVFSEDTLRSWRQLPGGQGLKELENVLQQDIHYSGARMAEINCQTYQIGKSKYKGNRFIRFFKPLSTRDLSLRRPTNWVLVAILAFAFCAIGYSSGSLEVLKEKMADPFVNWINIEIAQKARENVSEVRSLLDSDSARVKYSIDAEFPYNRFGLNFQGKRGQSFSVFGRTIDPADRILRELGKNENLLQGTMFLGENDIGVIITRETADRFDIGEKNLFISWTFRTGLGADTKEIVVRLPLRAIVKNLPGESSFLVTNYFYSKYWTDYSSPFNPMNTHSIQFFCPGAREDAGLVSDALKDYLMSIDTIKSMLPDVSIEVPDKERSPNDEGYLVKANFFPPNIFPWQAVLPVAEGFKRNRPDIFNRKYQIVQLYEYPNSAISPTMDFNRISISVKDLEHVSELRNLLMKYGFEIEMSKVESLNNYRFVVRMTNSLSIAIIAISIISVCIFMGYILYLHLYKIRGFLGLLKAFGVPQLTLGKVYAQSLIRSLLQSVVVGFALASIIGYSLMLRFIISLGFDIDRSYSYFDLANIYPILFAAILISLSYVSIRTVSNKMLSRSPGDLLYDRVK